MSLNPQHSCILKCSHSFSLPILPILPVLEDMLAPLPFPDISKTVINLNVNLSSPAKSLTGDLMGKRALLFAPTQHWSSPSALCWTHHLQAFQHLKLSAPKTTFPSKQPRAFLSHWSTKPLKHSTAETIIIPNKLPFSYAPSFLFPPRHQKPSRPSP